MAKKSKPVRRQRRHGDLPAGFRWRDARPRWEPSPARRAAGWRGQDLKDAWGRWLGKGEAIAKAEAIAAAVAGWGAGEPVPPAFLAIAPKGAATAGTRATAESARSIGVLIEGFLADPKPRTQVLGERTRADYRVKLNRLVGAMAAACKVTAADFRTLDVDALLPFPGKPFLLSDAYEALRTEAGEHMAHGVMAAASAWLSWVVKRKHLLPMNPALHVARATPKGRIVVYDWAEMVALVGAAEWLGLASVADAVILGVDLSWSQQDLLALKWGQVSRDGHVKHRRIKTGVAGNPPLLAPGRGRIARIRARDTVEKIASAPVLVCELTGKPWLSDHFRHAFDLVRSVASADAGAPILDKQFRDLRDTAVTYGYEAGLTIPEICSRTLHDPERAGAVLAKHYGAIRQDVADAAALRLDAHFAAKGYTFEKEG